MRVLRPSTIEEAVKTYARHADAVPLAGGTDFMVAFNAGGENERLILDLGAMTSWKRVRESGGGLRIGGTRDALAAANRIRGWRNGFHFSSTRARPSVGGRSKREEPWAGTSRTRRRRVIRFRRSRFYDARVRVLSTAGRRTLPIVDVFAGVKKTVLDPGELIESIDIDYPRKPARELFRKVGTRAASAISKTVAAGLLWLRKDGTVRELRFALGSMAPDGEETTGGRGVCGGEEADDGGCGGSGGTLGERRVAD